MIVGCKGNPTVDPLDVTGFTLSLAPASLAVVQGATGTTAVTVHRISLLDPVTLSLGGAPTGVTGSFNPTTVSGTTSTLTLNVDSSVAAGVYHLSVVGAGSTGGLLTPLTLSVTTGATGSGKVALVEAGTAHTCAIKTSGLVYCWGWNGWGQLGDGTTIDRPFPALIAATSNFTTLSAGAVHTCGVTTGGAAYCWGNNGYGALGDGTSTDDMRPTLVLGGLIFSAIAATGSPARSCGLTTSNSAYCWGFNPHGEIGDSTISNRLVPTLVFGGNFASVTAGALNTCGVKSTGAAFCWGFNSDGQVGDGNYYLGVYSWAVPTAVVGGLTFASVSAGDLHTCGVTTSGAAYCWGDNSHGELGDSTLTTSAVPMQVSGGLAFATVKAGNAHSCGVTTSGAAYCWGANFFGQLGDGTTTSQLVPVAVTGGLRFSTVSPGGTHTCGLTQSGVAYCWGNNGSGQLGDGTLVNRLVPTAVVFP